MSRRIPARAFLGPVPVMGGLPAFPAADERAGAGPPIEIEHVHGTTVIDRTPVRVAALGVGDADILLSLGVIPAMALAWSGTRGVSPDRSRGAAPPVLSGAIAEFGTAAVAHCSPDLIVAVNIGLGIDAYRSLSRIAPTVHHGADEQPWFLDWRSGTRRIGAAVRLRERAEDVIADAEGHLESVRSGTPALDGRSAAFVRILGPGLVRVYSPSSPRGRLLGDLGFRPPEALEGGFGAGMGVDLHIWTLEHLECDVLIVENPEAVHRDLVDIDAWAALEVVRDCRIVGLDAFLGDAITTLSPLGIPFVATELISRVGVALRGA